jgi:glutaconyl-CoA/methylmalonyl-CoA decarboxylase subunit gamma
MKKFKVTVDGQTFDVSVEEISEEKNLQSVSSAAYAEKEAKPALPVEKKPVSGKSPQKSADKQAKPVSSGGSGGTAVPAPMPGSIIDILVQVGDTISDGKVLVILEAMKMENEVTSPQAGTILEVLVKKGDTVNSGDPLVLIG